MHPQGCKWGEADRRDDRLLTKKQKQGIIGQTKCQKRREATINLSAHSSIATRYKAHLLVCVCTQCSTSESQGTGVALRALRTNVCDHTTSEHVQTSQHVAVYTHVRTYIVQFTQHNNSQLLGRATEEISPVLPIPIECLLPLAPTAEPSCDSPIFRP